MVVPASNSFAASSVLQTGNWFKISVSERGIYKLSHAFFKNMGLDPSSFDPKNIRIYGNGGALLPESNAAPRPDDLIENAIYVNGESEGVFNDSDYVLFYAP